MLDDKTLDGLAGRAKDNEFVTLPSDTMNAIIREVRLLRRMVSDQDRDEDDLYKIQAALGFVCIDNPSRVGFADLLVTEAEAVEALARKAQRYEKALLIAARFDDWARVPQQARQALESSGDE